MLSLPTYLPAEQYPPRIESETEHEFRSRSDINVMIRGQLFDGLVHVVDATITPFDRKGGGKASGPAVAVRKLWDCIPEELQEKSGNTKTGDLWQPYACIAGIAKFCRVKIPDDKPSRYVRNIVNQ